MAQTCFQGAADIEANAACHGVGGAKDIKSVLSRSSAHPVLDSTEHTNMDVLYGEGNTEPDDVAGKGVKFSDSKHAVCMDCHNPHKAQPETHAMPADPTGWYPATPNINTNLVSNALQGASGVEPTWPGTAWTQPTSFTTMKSAEKEYQICMKCHSYWGLGSSPNGISVYTLTSTGDVMTDLAFELAPMNASAHPVVVTLNNRTGSSTPRALDPKQLKDPWKTNNGNQTMYCSDCHGSDNETSGDPRGPHGSDLKYVLKGLNQYWPKKSDGSTLWDLDDLGDSGGMWGGGAGDYTGLFCSNCHDLMEPHKNQWGGMMSGVNANCVECHQVIPHGSSATRLLGYANFPAPYNYNGNSLKMTSYTKTSLTTVSKWNASSNSGSCQCH
jgi:hypothetical protein